MNMQGVESVKVNEFKPVSHLKQWTVHMRTKEGSTGSAVWMKTRR